MSELHDLLERATDHLAAPPMAGVALAEARRRRARRRQLVTGAAVVVAAAAVAVPVWLGGAPTGEPPVGSPTSPPTGSPAGEPTGQPSPRGGPGEATQPVWDPFTVEDAPVRESALPEELEPPESAPGLADEPMAAAVVAWPQEGADLRLLGTDGAWRSVPGTADPEGAYTRPMVGMPSISHDSTRVATSTEEGLLVVDVTTGEGQSLPWPEPASPPWDVAPALRWLADDEALLVHHGRKSWLMGLDGSVEPAPYAAAYAGPLAVDPDGPVVELADDTLVTWQDGRVVARAPAFFWGDRLAAGYGLVAFTGAPDNETYRDGPMVVDARLGETVAYAPIVDRNAVYSDNGHLTAVGFLDDETVLLLVGPMDFRTMDAGDERWHLVAWDFRTGGFERLASGGRAMRNVAVAPGLVDPQ